MQEYAGVCKNSQEYAQICKSLLRYVFRTRVLRHFLGMQELLRWEAQPYGVEAWNIPDWGCVTLWVTDTSLTVALFPSFPIPKKGEPGDPHLVCWIQLCKLCLLSLLHQWASESRKVELVSNLSDHLPEEPSQSSQVVFLASEELLEHHSQQLEWNGDRMEVEWRQNGNGMEIKWKWNGDRMERR